MKSKLLKFTVNSAGHPGNKRLSCHAFSPANALRFVTFDTVGAPDVLHQGRANRRFCQIALDFPATVTDTSNIIPPPPISLVLPVDDAQPRGGVFLRSTENETLALYQLGASA